MVSGLERYQEAGISTSSPSVATTGSLISRLRSAAIYSKLHSDERKTTTRFRFSVMW
jgi:hypothetical protein